GKEPGEFPSTARKIQEIIVYQASPTDQRLENRSVWSLVLRQSGGMAATMLGVDDARENISWGDSLRLKE
ncbi:MAG TPA: hypothetical protein VI756_05415, partial [Blastocatellia bacterium]